MSASQGFLQHLHELVYSDTSIEAHLKPAGLMSIAGILLTDRAPEPIKKNIEQRMIHQYKFRQAAKVWQRLADKSFDAKDVYEARYKSKFL